MKRPPLAFVSVLVAIAGIALLFALVALGIVPIDNVIFLLYGNVLLFGVVLVFAALGGAFVGMIVAQRIFSAREFTPLERSLVEALAELKAMRERQDEIAERLQRIEKR